MTRQDHVLDELTLDEIHERIQRFRKSYPDYEGRIKVTLNPEDAKEIVGTVKSMFHVAEAAGTPSLESFGAAFDGQGGSDWFEDAAVPAGTVWIEHP